MKNSKKECGIGKVIVHDIAEGLKQALADKIIYAVGFHASDDTTILSVCRSFENLL